MRTGSGRSSPNLNRVQANCGPAAVLQDAVLRGNSKDRLTDRLGLGLAQIPVGFVQLESDGDVQYTILTDIHRRRVIP